ncbi:MAG: hypothetical protein KKH75_09490, partial [Actinobacteria bacterium]|nr:hypothetical protein [Actinomycetota bacterium]
MGLLLPDARHCADPIIVIHTDVIVKDSVTLVIKKLNDGFCFVRLSDSRRFAHFFTDVRIAAENGAAKGDFGQPGL